ncbi:hypothetical protein PAPHI01_0857 [Pancytospora philotis]|nr:hypothetical protein PAPHI01_0857 [Pancytospora philotis]
MPEAAALASLVELGCLFYMIGITAGTLVAYFIARDYTKHGRQVAGISKRYYFLFYLLATGLLVAFGSPFALHTLRRLAETLIYSWRSKSRMTRLQLLHGLLYYAALSVCLRKKALHLQGLLALIVLQTLAHYQVYRLGRRGFRHYYAEIAIHTYLFYCVRSWALLFNLLYVVAFVLVSIKNRADADLEIRLLEPQACHSYEAEAAKRNKPCLKNKFI